MGKAPRSGLSIAELKEDIAALHKYIDEYEGDPDHHLKDLAELQQELLELEIEETVFRTGF